MHLPGNLMLTRRSLIKALAAPALILPSRKLLAQSGPNPQTWGYIVNPPPPVVPIVIPPPPTLPTAGLVARYIAGQGVTTPGGSVTAWADQVGSNNIVATSGTVTNPTVLGRPLVRCTINSFLTLPASLSFNNRSLSMFVVCRNQQAFNPQTASIPIMAVISPGAAGTNSSLYWGTAPNNNAFLEFHDSSPQATTIYSGFGITMVGAVLGASSATIIQAAEQQNVTQSSSGTVTGGYLNQYTVGNPFSEQVDLFEIAIYNAAVGSTELAAIRAYYTYVYGVQPTTDTFMATVGDSEAVGYGLANSTDAQWPNQLAQVAAHQPKWLNFAVAGTTLSQMNTAAAGANGANSYTTLESAFSNLIAIIDGGTNDIWINSASASAVETSMSTLRSTLLSGGFAQVWHVPIRPRGTFGTAPNPAFEATREAVNTWLTGASGFSSYVFSALLSTAAWSALDATNTTWYQSDTVHMTQAGWALQAVTMYPALQAAGILA